MAFLKLFLKELVNKCKQQNQKEEYVVFLFIILIKEFF